MLQYSELIDRLPSHLTNDYMIMVMKHLDKHTPGASEHLVEVVENMSKYDNFITEDEYNEYKAHLMNHNPGVTLLNCVEYENYIVSKGELIDHEPHYNKYALLLLSQYLWVKHRRFIDELVITGKYNKYSCCFIMATNYLKTEGKGWIRNMIKI